MLIYRKKTIVDKVSLLTATEHNEIFKILNSAGVPHSRNKNGCFFDMRSVDTKILENIENFVSYCIDCKKGIEEYNKQLSECKLRGTLRESEKLVIPSSSSSENSESGEEDESGEDEEDVVEDVVEEVEAEVEVEHQPIVDLAARKKSTSMFVNAKKRFSKQTIVDARDYDVSELVEE